MDIQEWLKQKLSGLGIEDKVFIAGLVFAGIFLFSVVSGFKHIPSPIYGGDYYMARGFTQAILQGTPFWQDPYFQGNYAYYGWLSYLLTAGLVRLTGTSLERMSVILPAVLQLFYLMACYLFGTAFFKSKRYGLLFTLAAFAMKILDLKLSGALAAVFMLLSLYSFIKFENGSKSHGYLMGLFMGLTALSHINSFMGLMLIVCFTIFIDFFIKLKGNNPGRHIIHTLKKYVPPLVIAIALAMLLVGPWLFVYHMKTLNPSQQYSTQDIDKLGLGWVFGVFIGLFIRKGLLPIIFGLVVLSGLIFCILNRKGQEQRFVLLWLTAATLGAAHFLITKPLLHNWIVPGYLWGAAVWVVELVLFVYGIKNLELMLSGLGIKKESVLLVALLFIIVLVINNYRGFNNDRWVDYGRTMDPGTQVLFDIEGWILENTPKDSVFLANDESSFALNALTGRRQVIARRTHASYYVDVQKRYADAIVMLYGNSKEKTLELLMQYNVTYLYLDSMLLQYPLITDLGYESYLKEYGINYTLQNIRLDPAALDAPSYDSIVVMPQQLRILEYNITLPIKQFMVQGQQPYSYLFRIQG